MSDATRDRPDPFALIAEHFAPDTLGFRVLVTHSVLVTQKALELARGYLERHPDSELDLEFLEEIGLLHDIGIARVDAPEIGCHGTEPYLRHGILGREMLEARGFPHHALACERHTGSGLTREDIETQKLPLPLDRSYLPQSLEEKLLCVADKFYGKKPGRLWAEKPLAKVHGQFAKFGEAAVARWERLWREVVED